MWKRSASSYTGTDDLSSSTRTTRKYYLIGITVLLNANFVRGLTTKSLPWFWIHLYSFQCLGGLPLTWRPLHHYTPAYTKSYIYWQFILLANFAILNEFGSLQHQKIRRILLTLLTKTGAAAAGTPNRFDSSITRWSNVRRKSWSWLYRPHV